MENYISDSGLEPSEDGREVFVAISTYLRETVTPDDLREIAQMHRSSQVGFNRKITPKQIVDFLCRLNRG